MTYLKYSILACFFLFCVARAAENSSAPTDLDDLSSKETDEVFLSLIQNLIREEYATNALEAISTIMKTMVETSVVQNLTLIGSQNIYNEDGSIKEIRTIELAIPKLQTAASKLQKNCSSYPEPKSKEDDDAYIDFNPDDFEDIRLLQDVIKSAYLISFKLQFLYMKNINQGQSEGLLYLNQDTLMVKVEGMYFINKTIELDSKQDVEDNLKEISNGPIPASKLYFDENGNFLIQESTVVPELLASASPGDGEPSNEIVKTALKGVVQSYLESNSKDEVPRKIQKFMEHEVPGFAFVVTAGEPPEAQHLTTNFSLHISYNLIDFGSEAIKYSIFGLNHNI